MDVVPIPDLLILFTGLSNPEGRDEALQALARYVGAEDVLIFVQDPELGILLPAPGFRKTLPGRSTWRDFLNACTAAAPHQAEVPYPQADTPCAAYGLRAKDESVLVLLGGTPDAQRAAQACAYVPLLAAALRGEQAGHTAGNHARMAREAAAQLGAVAETLDATRIRLQDALHTAAAANERLEHELVERRRAESALQQLNETLEQRVARRTGELEQANRQLRAEIDERLRVEVSLERSNKALAQSNRELQDFAYVASHDLQEPLRKISSFVDLLRVDCGQDIGEKGHFYIDRVQRAAMRMSVLIRDLLAFSRVATQGQPFQEIDLNEIVSEVLLDLELRIAETKADVHVAPLPALEADPTQMRQLFQNLIGNALKFHRPGVPPEVEVTACQQKDSAGRSVCKFVVKDNGIGFDEKYRERIFAPFQRLHARNSPYEGTGMGLAICRHIIERHGGAITATSRPNEGATFTVTLPCHLPLQDEEALLTEEEGRDV